MNRNFAFISLFVLAGACSSGGSPDIAPGDGAAAASPDAGAGGSPDASRPDAPPSEPPFVPAPHLAWPTIPMHGGHVLDPLRVVTVVADDEPYATELGSFGDAIGSSAWFASFASEYGLSGTPSHVLVKGAHVAPGTSFAQADMNAYIAATLAAASPSLAPDGHTVYVLYLPPGTNMIWNGVPDTTCAGIPYHTGYGALGDGMAVLNRCPGSFPSQLDMFTAVAAHEISEAATDANPSKNPAWAFWADDAAAPWKSSVWTEVETVSSAEIGDLCIFTRVVEKGFAFQRTFSNAAAAKGGDPCVPALAVPFFAVTPDPKTAGWIPATPGATVHVPLVGWSTAKTADWLVLTAPGKGKAGASFPATVTSPTTRTVGKYTYPTTNNGLPSTLDVTIPSGVASGWWGAVALWSMHIGSTGTYVDGEDFGHESVVGFYVP